MQTVIVRGIFAYDADLVSDETGLLCADESLAVQDERDEVDINNIIARFLKTGVLPSSLRVPRQGDFTEARSMQDSLQLILQAEDAFMELPADMRARFHHDAAEFVEFVSDEKNLPELRKLGLANPLGLEPAPVRVIVENAPPQAA